MDILIFVILGGVVEFDFSRLLKIMDELVEENVVDGKCVIAQRGHSKYIPHNYDSFPFVDGEKFNYYIEHADLIISHGGIASLISALEKNKKIIVFPRLAKYGEHLDDHQTEVGSIMSEQGYNMYAVNKEQLKSCILKAPSFSPKEFKGNNTLMETLVVDYIDNNC